MSVLPARILVVDDDIDTCAVMLRLLRSQGYEARAARTCREAMQLAEAESIDLLITDLLLPDGDGLTVLQHLRQRYPVEGMLISGVEHSYDDVVMSIEAQHFAVRLLKPVCFETLQKSIEKLLEPMRRAALSNKSVEAARSAHRAQSLRERIRCMTNEELSALVQSMKRHGEDLKEELLVLGDMLKDRQSRVAQRSQ